MKEKELKVFLNKKVDLYNQPSFIKDDPITIPHRFSKKQDIEIAGFFAAVFAWGNRTTIIRKSGELMQLMDNAPLEFCIHHTHADLKRLAVFKHRTFNYTDLLYFISFFKQHYKKYNTLEAAFSPSTLLSGKQAMSSFFQGGISEALNMEVILEGFYQYFFSLEHVPLRTKKHIASPQRKSTCKRLNMFLRWMVRQDNAKVDFGIWKTISPSQLICPIDLHVARVARKLNILERKQTDWLAAQELTDYLRTLDPHDPVKYDFALFGLGVMEKF
jgi:uncharacterized protein (TIGR02757 family)